MKNKQCDMLDVSFDSDLLVIPHFHNLQVTVVYTNIYKQWLCVILTKGVLGLTHLKGNWIKG